MVDGATNNIIPGMTKARVLSYKLYSKKKRHPVTFHTTEGW
ncbi:hypothetical protein AG1IA_10088 [Rhizoctonia solani AG-1 IA]|uniref:Uncharacterized protein n=1 Tax=Thanatephorus cucumeris (strain AG1-IA) TaxID=983506 RepID=L8WGN9_THACA|nr:hypothetical protein AG1IA_10088 [Rhizoctonia solani AG-1 IA]